jgi:hypothetical protein
MFCRPKLTLRPPTKDAPRNITSTLSPRWLKAQLVVRQHVAKPDSFAVKEEMLGFAGLAAPRLSPRGAAGRASRLGSGPAFRAAASFPQFEARAFSTLGLSGPLAMEGTGFPIDPHHGPTAARPSLPKFLRLCPHLVIVVSAPR